VQFLRSFSVFHGTKLNETVTRGISGFFCRPENILFCPGKAFEELFNVLFVACERHTHNFNNTIPLELIPSNTLHNLPIRFLALDPPA